jgi:creatinine amidohydrolase
MTVYRLEYLSFKQVGDLDKEKTIVVLPCGSMEQHGPHLPNGMDTQVAVKITDNFTENLANKLDFLVLPPISFGQSPEHMDFPGTITFSAETYIRMLKEVCGSIARHGFKKLYIINGHGGNISAISAAAFDIRDATNLKIFMFNVWAVITGIAHQTDNREAGDKTDAHGGEIETSLIQYLSPELVHLEWAVDEENSQLARGDVLQLGGPITFNWNSLQDIAPSGISGIPSLGSAAKGEAIYKALVELAINGALEIDKNW